MTTTLFLGPQRVKGVLSETRGGDTPLFLLGSVFSLERSRRWCGSTFVQLARLARASRQLYAWPSKGLSPVGELAWRGEVTPLFFVEKYVFAGT